MEPVMCDQYPGAPAMVNNNNNKYQQWNQQQQQQAEKFRQLCQQQYGGGDVGLRSRSDSLSSGLVTTRRGAGGQTGARAPDTRYLDHVTKICQ